MSFTCISALGELGFTRTAIVVALGRSSRSSPSRFGSRSKINEVTPVMLPPGRLRLGTRPLLTGSLPLRETIGMVAVAVLAASVDSSPPVATPPPVDAQDRRRARPVDRIVRQPSDSPG